MADPSLFRAPRTVVMGVVNVTPDSFSDGGLFLDPEKAIRHAGWLAADGADILDVGGESTRPGSEAVSVDEELSRVRPVVEALVRRGGASISIDTRNPQTADVCLGLGARILNDVGGLRDPEMLHVAARHGASVVVMHMRGEPRTMQEDPQYADVVCEVRDWLAERVEAARMAGIRDIAVDPGIGFGKSAQHNFELLARLNEFKSLGVPVLIGPSRKRFLAAVAGMESPDQRLEGTIAACVAAVLAGASVVRVHDVAECVRAVRVADAIRGAAR